MQLFESQISTALAEANARKRVVQEYEAKMLEMEKRYQDRMRDEVRSSFPYVSALFLFSGKQS